MLRSSFVLLLIAFGAYYAIQGPFYALLFFIGNAYFRPEDWVWNDYVASLRLSLISGAYLVLASLYSRQRFVWNSRIALLWLFLFHTLLSTLGSEHFVHSWGYWTDFLKTIIITYLIVVLVDDFSKFRLVLIVMSLALGAEQARQGWLYLLTSPGWENSNHVAFLGDNNGVTVGMLMLVPIIGLLGQTTKNKWTKGCFLLLFIGCLYRALSTYSRGGFLAAVAMGGFWWLRTQHKVRGVIAVAVLVAVIVPMLPEAFWIRVRTIETYEENQDASALGRLHFWAVAVKMANANPLLGVGYTGFNPAYDKYDFSAGTYGTKKSVHSSILGVLAELGYLGATLYVVILIGAFRCCGRVRRMALKHPAFADLGKSAISLQASLFAFVVGGSFVIFQYNEMLWHIIGLTIALERLAVQHQTEFLSGENSQSLESSAATSIHLAA